MKIPLEMTFRGIEKTPELEELIRVGVAKLEQICDHIISCRVAVEKAQAHQRSGSPYRIRIDLRIPPGHELAVKHGHHRGDAHETLPRAIREAFANARRRVKELVERQRGEVKTRADWFGPEPRRKSP